MSLTVEQSLAQSRRLWVIFMGWQFICILIHTLCWGCGYRSLFGPAGLVTVQILATVVVLLVMWGVRSHFYKAHWVGNVITPVGYLRAHETMGCVSFVTSLVFLPEGMELQNQMLGLVTPIILLGAMVLMFPDGKPMQDHPIRL